MRSILIRAALLLAVVAVALSAATVEARTVTIAVVRDGPSEMNDIVEGIRPELVHLVGQQHDVVFDFSDDYDAMWDPARMKTVVQNALRNKSVDMILGIGILVTQEAARPDLTLTKPFVSATILNGDIPKIEFSEVDKSLKDDLCLVVWPRRVDSDVDVVKTLSHPDKLYVGIDEVIAQNLADFGSAMTAYGELYGLEIVPIYLSNEWRGVIEQIDPTDAVFYILDTPRLSTAERRSFVAELNRKKVYTFSGVGTQDLDLGVLATNRPDIRRELARRVAINLYQLITGAKTDDLPVLLVADTKLVLDARTAVAVGYEPFFETRAVAKILHPEAFESGAKPIDIPGILEMAEKGNASLAVSRAQMETSLRERQVARSPMFPQLGINGNYRYNDNNLVGNLIPERWGQFGVTLRQMIFDDELVSGFRVSDRYYEAAQFQNQSNRLDVLREAEWVYLGYVQARLLYEIQQSNLQLTEGNLEISKMRAEVGHSGRDEVYRWEAEVAQQRTVVLNTESIVESARISMNQVLGVDQGTRWRPEPVKIESERFETMKNKLGFVIGSPATYAKFMDAAVAVAMENSPEMHYLYKTAEAQEIRVGYRKRSYIVPKFFADLNYNNNVYQSPDEPKLGDYFLEARIYAELPIFEGTRKIYDSKREQAVLLELENRITLARQLVEQRVRTALRRLQSSIPNIKYTRIASDNAGKNFTVVRDKYANGIVTITDLLVAQTASFAADLDATSAVYIFMKDMTELQRATSFFVHDNTEEDIDAFLQRIRELMESD
jgi:outer membrane protein